MYAFTDFNRIMLATILRLVLVSEQRIRKASAL